MDNNISGDEIAKCVLNEFSKWPSKRKPLNRNDGVKEWVPLAGIVAEVNGKLTCLAVATGMKCLPQNKIPMAKGNALHDWHAEILAIRSLNRFLLEECRSITLLKDYKSEYIRFRSPEERIERHFQPFSLKDGVRLHMYCSEAPCGDASMELTMSLQTDSTPWKTPPPASHSLSQPQLPGRAYFSLLSLIRRKPSRPDAPPSLSKSCSDKLTLKLSTSLLSSLSSLLISPDSIYLSTLTLPDSQYTPTAIIRCFSPSGRLSPLFQGQNQNTTKNWQGGYTLHALTSRTTTLEFPYSRRQILQAGEKLVPSNLASYSTPNNSESLIGGSLQGRKQFSVKGASPTCKARMWKFCLEIAEIVKEEEIALCLRADSYLEIKESQFLNERREVKRDVRTVLGGKNGEAGWVRNLGGEDFSLSDEIEA